MATKTKVKHNWFAILGLLCGNLLFFLTIWMGSKYEKVSIDQFIYAMKASSSGANSSLLGSAFIRVGVFGVGLTVLEVLFYMLCSGSFQERFKQSKRYLAFQTSRLSKFIVKRALPLALAILIVGVSFFVVGLDVVGYVSAITTESKFIENHYVDPETVSLQFPEKKRNLIYIFLESMEVGYSDPAAGGPIIDNFIPELTQLAEDNINFSHTEQVGGAYSYTGTTWTAAALFNQTSGLVMQVPLLANAYGGDNGFVSGAVSLGDLLEKHGYQQTILFGSDGEFGGRKAYFEEHGNYNVVDIKALKAEGRLPNDYLEWWGFEDEKLFAFAKEELTKISQSGEPFNFSMLTADSHFPDGYVCRLCGEEYDAQYPNVLRCSSRQVSEFIQWIQQQPFYENTTIVLSGDHLTMDPNFMKETNEDYVRTIYNCIINAPLQPVQEKNREFGTFDMFPTTLAAMGVTFEGDRLGLGTNLFSETKTLTEQYGFDMVNTELLKNSSFYNKKFLQMGIE